MDVAAADGGPGSQRKDKWKRKLNSQKYQIKELLE